jgi:hypothetical protein
MPNDGIEKFRFEGHLMPPGKPRARVSVIGGFAEDDLPRLDIEVFSLGDRDERARAACLALGGPENVRWIENERMEDGHLELVGMRNFSSASTSHGHVSMAFDVWAMQRGIHLNKETMDRKFNVVVWVRRQRRDQLAELSRSSTDRLQIVFWGADADAIVRLP